MKMFRVFMILLMVAGALSLTAAEVIKCDGSTTVGPIAKAFAEYFNSEYRGKVSVEVSESGSGNGAKALQNSTAEVANLSRFMKDKEFKACVEGGIFPVAHVVALDGIAMVVHPSNPVKNLTIEQIRDIYMGKITNWRDLGGPNQEIVMISRDTNSGTYETFEKLVMKKEKITDKAEYVGSNGAARQRVQSTKGAIGYVGIGFLDRSIKALTVNGVEVNADTIISGDYPIARPLYMFTNQYPKMGSWVYKFVTFHLTEKGQKMIEEIGFIPLTRY